jgi:two-component system, OmpR family, sensor histidine kinase KdpD
MARGELRIYLGAAPGVGKTYAMLAEGQRRRSRGTDVVAALVEPHGRRLTTEMAEELETIPRRTMSYRGATFTEMDVDAVLARHPQVALVDELAHTNVPGCRNAKRWQDVEELLDAGINVVTTLNVQHLESLSDVARQITGVAHTETLPDAVARRAGQVELVDMTPEALRRRMVHGNIYPPDRIEAALTHYFRPGNLTALRELALLWVADRVEEGLQRYRAAHGIAAPWETSERIMVGISGGPGDEAVIRRAARIAARSPGSKLLAVHVRPEDGLRGAGRAMDTQRALIAAVGGSFQEIPGTDVAAALLAFARAEDATQMVLGASRRRIRTLFSRRSVPSRLAAAAGHIDVHLVGHEPLSADLKRMRPRWSRWARRERERRASAEAAALGRLAVAVLAGRGDPPALLEEVRDMFGLAAVSLLERRGPAWDVVASAGEHPPEAPEAPGAPEAAGAQAEVQVSDTLVLAGRGRVLSADEARVLEACAIPLVTGIGRRRRETTDAAAADEAWHRSRWTVLAATSHDVRNQIAAARSALTGIAAGRGDERAGQLAAAWRALYRIDRVAADLGALGRLHAGALETYLRPADLDEVLAAVLDDLGPGGRDITLGPLDTLPDVIADAALLARVLTSLLADALAHCQGEARPSVTASSADGVVSIRVTAPGRWTDPDGLPVRLAGDLTEAMGATLGWQEGQDGSQTVVITLPAARGTGPGPGENPAVAVAPTAYA